MCYISIGDLLHPGGTRFYTTWHAVKAFSYLLLLSKFLTFPCRVVSACLKPTQEAVVCEVECQEALA